MLQTLAGEPCYRVYTRGFWSTHSTCVPMVPSSLWASCVPSRTAQQVRWLALTVLGERGLRIHQWIRQSKKGSWKRRHLLWALTNEDLDQDGQGGRNSSSEGMEMAGDLRLIGSGEGDGTDIVHVGTGMPITRPLVEEQLREPCHCPDSQCTPRRAESQLCLSQSHSGTLLLYKLL